MEEEDAYNRRLNKSKPVVTGQRCEKDGICMYLLAFDEEEDCKSSLNGTDSCELMPLLEEKRAHFESVISNKSPSD